MALSKAKYQQGFAVSSKPEGKCGQAIVYPTALQIYDKPWKQPDDNPWLDNAIKQVTPESRAFYSHAGAPNKRWEGNWKYRRMSWGSQNKSATPWNTLPAVGDITQINVNQGNDYPGGYIFLSEADTEKQTTGLNWAGGVDVQVLRDAETHALGYIGYMRSSAPNKSAPDNKDDINYIEGTDDTPVKDMPKLVAPLKADPGSSAGQYVGPSTVFGTNNGLSKVPYMRDTRRSIGNDGFQIDYDKDTLPGRKPAHPVGIGIYAADIHGVTGCPVTKLTDDHPYPFYLPMEALMNDSFDNLVVAGKTMAQDFATNSASRLHPIEFSSGTAAGVVAHYMTEFVLSTKSILNSPSDGAYTAIATRLGRHQPIDWNYPTKADFAE